MNNKSINNNPFFDPLLKKRQTSATRFKIFTTACIIFAISFLVFFVGDMVIKGLPAFQQSYIKIDVTYNEQTITSTRRAIDKKYRKISISIFANTRHFICRG